MLLAFGVMFELPVFTFFLARLGVVNHKMMIGAWRYSMVGIFIVAAVFTPGPDVASQMLMATPLLVLYVGEHRRGLRVRPACSRSNSLARRRASGLRSLESRLAPVGRDPISGRRMPTELASMTRSRP